jgi:hypothetical protein
LAGILQLERGVKLTATSPLSCAAAGRPGVRRKN